MMASSQKHQRQEMVSDTRAAMTAPRAAPVGPEAPKQAKAMLRFSPMGKVRPMMAMALGMTRAGPMPWNALQVLNRMSWSRLQKPEINDQTANQAHPAMKTRLCPWMSPSLPECWRDPESKTVL